jgi:hypothetical protein
MHGATIQIDKKFKEMARIVLTLYLTNLMQQKYSLVEVNQR